MNEKTTYSGTSSIAVREAQLHLVFPFVRTRRLSRLAPMRQQMAQLGLLELNKVLDIPLNAKQRQKLSSSTLKVWEDDDKFTLDRAYFHDFVQSIFGANEEKDNNYLSNSDIRSLKPLRLTTQARNLISGAVGQRGSGLCLALRKSAKDRLESVNYKPDLFNTKQGEKLAYLPFNVENCHCLFFGTGVGILLIEIDIFKRMEKNASVPIEYLMELANRLCRAKYWKGAPKDLHCFRLPPRKAPIHQHDSIEMPEAKESEISAVRGLGPICAALLGESVNCKKAPSKFLPIHWEKAPIFCGVKSAPFPDKHARDIACIRLARKETLDYIPNSEAVEDAFYRPFSYLTHAASIEGGVMLVEVDPEKEKQEKENQVPAYVKNFVTNSTRRAYLPLMLWAMHEYLFLTELSKSASGWVDFRNTKEEDMLVLRNFRARIYNYRFHFRFSHASAISMHNDMFRLWRKTYDLGTILDEVDRDVAETDNNLESFYAERARRKQGRSRLILGLFVAVAGTVISIPDWTNRRMTDIVPTEFCTRFPWLCWDFSLHYIIVALFLFSSVALGVLLLSMGTSRALRRLRIWKIRKKFEI